jgi:hypothetical protein
MEKIRASFILPVFLAPWEESLGGSQSRLALVKNVKPRLKSKVEEGWGHGSSGRALA